jgi:hypothetical protein
MFHNLRQLDYLNRLDKVRLWTLEERQNRADLIEVFKLAKGISATPLQTFFTTKTSGKTRGHQYKLKKILQQATLVTFSSHKELSTDGMHYQRMQWKWTP